MQNWTIQKLLSRITEYLTAAGTDSPRLSAELLLSHALDLKRIELYTSFDKTVQKERLDKLRELVKRAGSHEPIAYLTGKAGFYSLEFVVTADCMIPRPETELLAQRAIEFLRNRTGPQAVCDLCTGSGCIAVAIAKNHHNCHITATDISRPALRVAAQNVANHQLSDRIRLLHGDLFEPVASQKDSGRFDLIVCNPPYISDSEFAKLDKNVREYEPKLALLAGTDGLDIHTSLIDQAHLHLKPAAVLMLEIGCDQGLQIEAMIEKSKVFTEIKIEKDFQNHDRLAIAATQSGVTSPRRPFSPYFSGKKQQVRILPNPLQTQNLWTTKG